MIFITVEQEIVDIKERVMSYVKSERKACIKDVQGIKRFLKFINDKRYYVDWKLVMMYNRWSGMFTHSKGVLAGQPISPTDWQLYLVTNLLALKRVSDDTRAFREAYIQIARKNAKTQLSSTILSFIAFLSDEQEEIYIAGWSREQSNLAYGETLRQVSNVDMLKGKFSDSYNMIRVFKNGSIIKALSREARKTGDGTNPSVTLIDEYHVHETDEIVEVQKTGMVARQQPLLIYITTAGLNTSSPCKEMYDYCSRVLDPEQDTENDSLFIDIHELDKDDDITDESNWIKANPIIATYQAGMESLRQSLKIALDRPDKMRDFMTKNLNLWVDHSKDGYMNLRKWNEQAVSDEAVEEILKNGNVYVGVDLSMTTDLTSVSLVGVYRGQYAVKQVSYIPEDKYKERMTTDKFRYDLAVDNGVLKLTEGSIVDYEVMQADVLNYCKEYNVKEVCYDKWNATHFANALEAIGITVVEIPQRIAQLTEPTKGFRRSVYDKKLVHTHDSLLKWCMSNAITKSDDQENMMISKKVSRNRIDPIAATLNAYARAMYDDQTKDLESYLMSDDFSF